VVFPNELLGEEVSSENKGPAKLEEVRGGMLAVSKTVIESWKISRRRVDAIVGDLTDRRRHRRYL